VLLITNLKKIDEELNCITDKKLKSETGIFLAKTREDCIFVKNNFEKEGHSMKKEQQLKQRKKKNSCYQKESPNVADFF
jgi:hypothetical protein